MNYSRRAFLKIGAAAFSVATTTPIIKMIPRRMPFVQMGRGGLMDLASHLGVLPSSSELGICEGVVRHIGAWDGNGYPCTVENVCTFGANRPVAVVYDFDLWNFRDDDSIGPLHKNKDYQRFNNHASFYASRRFGKSWHQLATECGGWLKNHPERQPAECRQATGGAA